MHYQSLTCRPLVPGVPVGWHLGAESKMWELAEIIQVRPFLVLIGHSLFVISLIGFIVLLLCCLGIYVWVFNAFQVRWRHTHTVTCMGVVTQHRTQKGPCSFAHTWYTCASKPGQGQA